MTTDWVTPFSLQKPIWRENLVALQKSHPSIAVYARSLRDPGTVRVREIDAGIYEAQRVLSDGQTLTFDRATSEYQINLLRPRIAESVSGGSELIVLAESGAGTIFLGLAPVFARFQNWQMLVVERDLLWIAVLARLIPLAGWLSNRRLYFASAEEGGVQAAVEQYGLGNRTGIGIFSGLPQQNEPMEAAIRAAIETDYRNQNNLADRVSAYYRENLPSECRSVLCVDLWRNSAGGFMQEGIAEALTLNHLTVHRLTLPTQSTPPDSIFRKEHYPHVLRALDRLKPDLLLSMQHDLGYFLPRDVCEHLCCPNAVYSVDTFPCEETPGRERRLYVCGAQELLTEGKAAYPLSTYIPYGTDLPPAIPVSSHEFACPVSFLGNAGPSKQSRQIMEDGLRKHGLVDLAERMIERLFAGDDFFCLCRAESLETLPENQRTLIQTYVLNEQLRRGRTMFLKPLIPFGLRLYGSTWQTVDDDPAIQSVAHDNVPYSHRFDLYASSTINIDISRYTSPSIRFFEVPATRAFMLALRRDSYLDFFSEEETVYFSTPDELVEKVDYFLTHPDAREPYIEKGYNRICSALTWGHWVNAFLTNIVPPYLRILAGSEEDMPPNAGYPSK